MPPSTTALTANPWIYNELNHTPINILRRLQAKLSAESSSMRIAITEYENGGWNGIAGTIAQADNLRIFAGFRAYRGFDGANACFLDTSPQATSSKVKNVVVYASLDSAAPGRVVLVAINRSTLPQVTDINGQPLSGTAHLYQMTAASAQTQVAAGQPVAPVPAGTLAVSGSSLTVTRPPLSVTSIDVN